MYLHADEVKVQSILYLLGSISVQATGILYSCRSMCLTKFYLFGWVSGQPIL